MKAIGSFIGGVIVTAATMFLTASVFGVWAGLAYRAAKWVI